MNHLLFPNRDDAGLQIFFKVQLRWKLLSSFFQLNSRIIRQNNMLPKERQWPHTRLSEFQSLRSSLQRICTYNNAGLTDFKVEFTACDVDDIALRLLSVNIWQMSYVQYLSLHKPGPCGRKTSRSSIQKWKRLPISLMLHVLGCPLCLELPSPIYPQHRLASNSTSRSIFSKRPSTWWWW